MSQQPHPALQRAFSLGAAAVLTLVMLGGIGQLAQTEPVAPQWAQQTAVRA